jgi:hypothetical protein
MKGACREMQRCDFTSAEVPPLQGVATKGGGAVQGGDDVEEDEEVSPSKYYIVKPTLY